MKELAIIGAGYMAKIVAEEARRKEIKTCCFSNDLNSVAKEAVDTFYPVSIFEKDKIVEICREVGVEGVFATTELTIEIAAYVADKLGLISNPLDIMQRITNKVYVREKTTDVEGLSSPTFCLLHKGEAAPQIRRFPVIVKPGQLGGKRGITVVNNDGELVAALAYAWDAIGNREQPVIIEEYLSGGAEYSVEGLSYQGEHYIIQVTEKISSGPPHCVELGHMQPARLSVEMRRKVEEVVKRILLRLNVRNGASHTEIKVLQDRIYLIEVNFRPGGDHIAYPLTELSTGYPYIGGAIDIAMGCFHAPLLDHTEQKYAGVLFVTNQTAYLKELLETGETKPWMYQINRVSKKLQDITHNDGYHTNYIMYAASDTIPSELELLIDRNNK